MFNLIGYLLKELDAKVIQWHFLESGHRKGAPDGVGATLKRNADDLVAKGADYQTIVPLLKVRCPGIIIEPITAESIMEIDEEVPEDLATFKGTTQIHQLTLKTGCVLQVRRLTCLQGDPGSCYRHFHLGKIEIAEKTIKCILLKTDFLTVTIIRKINFSVLT
ncbi:hypothetical protein PR048_017450 [Dryococelus australis]|uniref:Uncharacterized protein n=1 Tax=Dryococelus australis TaxID=614101 RepID=A0ABQ9H9J4_9NEOP|nr:hypothetical protein PR048_017450 [Dryococelus australis]